MESSNKKMSARKKAALSDAIKRGMKRTQERNLPISRWDNDKPIEPQLSRFDEKFLDLYEKGYSERQMTKALKVGRGTIHRTKKLLGLLE
jgi:hypothetical protein